MAEEKSFLQNIKLEISRSFKLVPYERLAFHKIIGILKSDVGLSILIKELERGPDIRQSALLALASFNHPEALSTLLAYLTKNITDDERLVILDHVKRTGSAADIKAVIGFIQHYQEKQGSLEVTTRAYEVLGIIGVESEEVLKFVVSKINEERLDPLVRALAIESLSSFKSISVFENLLKKGEDAFCFGAYKAIYKLSIELAEKARQMKSEDDRLYTYSPDTEDKIVLEIRVLLGKMAHDFDSYSNRTKIAFICAMIACNHREYLIYTMKALTSSDVDLVSMVLYSLYQNVGRLRDPDKLFRSLIAISTEVGRFNEMIVDIFVKFFSMPVDSRSFNLLKDKLYSYIVVTLETYFETYRKEFMITDVIEKGLPESFQRIRRFLLNNCTPELKKGIITFLTQEEPSMVKHVMTDLSRRITYIEGSGIDDMKLLVEVLLDKDRKSRENSAARLEDLNFEKLYLRNRIVRLCRIIGILHIDEAASALVNVFNYLKKYPDKEILDATVLTLSILNYSYMLGEIEVMITTGSDDDRKNALSLLSLFTEQRSLNMILELLKNRLGEDSSIVSSALGILLERDIMGNITASQIFKGIVANNPSPAIRSLAVLGLGQCGFDSDIDYLNDLFYRMGADDQKDVVVRAMANITANSTSYNKRQLIRYLQEYLKDPGIKVRIYSCLLLAQMGNREAMRSIRDMLIIKNKNIQRDILTILGGKTSVEFSFFLLSLLKEEYGISNDIIPAINRLPRDEMKEIDAFIVNIFRKYEAPVLEGIQAHPSDAGIISIEGLKKERMTIMNVVIPVHDGKPERSGIPVLINLNLWLKSRIAAVIQDHGGSITRMSNENVVSYFPDTRAAAETAIEIGRNVVAYNDMQIPEHNINVYIQLLTETVKIINDEIILFPVHMAGSFGNMPVVNKVVIDQATMELLTSKFSIREIPELTLSMNGFAARYFELVSPINFTEMSDQIVSNMREEEEKREQAQQQLEAEMKKLKRGSRAASSAAIARGLDDLAQQLQNQLDEIDRYVEKRSTDRELIKNVRKMLNNVHNMYKVEISRLIID
ncbi:MAG: HEAT repeat domain-containing protein [Spirochaetes bacterium]|nr:HEAT repeat domain-containing protein [Spirochaetota bacterium]